jgi:N-acyl-D-aspartate/D-glutamate deacylase
MSEHFYDVILRHSQVIEGSGRGAFVADAAIRELQIGCPGRSRPSARETR